MKQVSILRKFWLIVMISLVIFMPLSNAFARGEERNSHNSVLHQGPQHSSSSYAHYRYRDGRFYRPTFFGLFDILIDVPPIGAFISILPSGRRTIVVDDTTYYYYNNVYYQDYASGYLVVPAPAVTSNVVVATSTSTRVKQPSQENITVNIPNTNGSYTSIDLIKQGNGYLGPQGEYYPSHPTVSQLRVLYGR
jgi:hypothetical protein